MDFDAALQTFIAESRELLADMETALLSLGHAPDGERDAGAADQGEAVNAIFRAAHTIKGSAGLFGLDGVVAFTHAVESLLDSVRAGRVAVDDELVVLLLSCCDHMTGLVDAVEAGAPAGNDAVAEALLAQINRRRGLAAAPAASGSAGAVASVSPRGAQVAPYDDHGDSSDGGDGADDGGSEHWHLSLRFGPDVLRNGFDPASFIRYLSRLGRIAGIVTLADSLPPAEQMDPESCYLGFEIRLDSIAERAEIEAVFEFVRDDCTLRLVPPKSRVADYLRLIDALPEDAARLGEMLVRCGSVTEHELQQALAAQEAARAQAAADAAAEVPRLGTLLVAQQGVPPAVVEAALQKQRQATETRPRGGEQRSLRVDADKLDQLITLVGELTIAGAGADLLARQTRQPALAEATSRLAKLVQDVRDSALSLRMVKIGATFGRFQRVVHDVAREIGKDIALEVSGEDTELDKTVVEKIGDPLLHLVRNAMDHGIESADKRLAAGKPARGTVGLKAWHDSGHIVIEVSDDGGGLPRERILAKAIERGLVEVDARLTDAEVHELIFEPGFSTAEQVTNLSGRGVGMDVVKRNITALRGTVSIRSELGRGTTVCVRLPLTLAIIDGFLVSAAGATFVLPLELIDECIEFRAAAGLSYCDLRGQVLPLLRLREFFGLQAAPPRRESVVVVQAEGQRVGLVVDSLLGESQTVIKPLAQVFEQAEGISGSTILGSGQVALILDLPALVRSHLRAESLQSSSPAAELALH